MDCDKISKLLHDVRQPLNIMMLCCANLRTRFGSLLLPEDAAYLEAKLERIEKQLNRISEMIATEANDRLSDSAHKNHE